MKNKYIPITGLAYNEQLDIKRLEKLSKDGWLLDSIVFGLFYKMKKSTPKYVKYSFDYQPNANFEYFDFFSQAGWIHHASYYKQYHIFSSEIGTTPIYSDKITEKEVLYFQAKQTKKFFMSSLISSLLLIIATLFSLITSRAIFLGLFTLTFLSCISLLLTSIIHMSNLRSLRTFENNTDQKKSRTATIILHFMASLFLMIAGVQQIVHSQYLIACLYFISSIIFLSLGILSKKTIN